MTMMIICTRSTLTVVYCLVCEDGYLLKSPISCRWL